MSANTREALIDMVENMDSSNSGAQKAASIVYLVALSPEHRVVIVRAYFGGATIAEIAVELGIPEGTVKSRLHYGLRALRLALQEKGVTR